MAYLVNISVRAQRDLTRIYKWIDAEDSDAALSWYRGFNVAILSLEEQPHRCPTTPENSQLRHLFYGNKPHITARYSGWRKRGNKWTCSTSDTARRADSRGGCSIAPSAKIWARPGIAVLTTWMISG